MSLEHLHPVTRTCFGNADAPTGAVLSMGRHRAWRVHATVAPTGSGKTLAAFLFALDRLMFQTPDDAPGKVVYISIKALAVDVERNLRAPLTGMAAVARRLDVPFGQQRWVFEVEIHRKPNGRRCCETCLIY